MQHGTGRQSPSCRASYPKNEPMPMARSYSGQLPASSTCGDFRRLQPLLRISAKSSRKVAGRFYLIHTPQHGNHRSLLHGERSARQIPAHTPPPSAKLYRLLLFLLVLISVANLIYSHKPLSLWLPTLPQTNFSPAPTAPAIPTTTRSAQHVIVKHPLSLPADPYRKYLDKVDQGSTGLRQLAFELLHPCPPADKSCAAVHLYHFVQANVGYLSDPPARDYIQAPEETLKIKAGDCEDLSILLASLLNNSGVPTYLVFTPDHAYTLACGV